MSLQIGGIEVRERRIGRQWLITSDLVPGLYVAHPDRETARKAVPEAVRMLRNMADRRPSSAVAADAALSLRRPSPTISSQAGRFTEGDAFSIGIGWYTADGHPFTMPSPQDEYVDADIIDAILRDRWVFSRSVPLTRHPDATDEEPQHGGS